MTLSERSFTSQDGLEIFERQWWKDEEVRAVIVVVHGGGEHSGRYEQVSEFLSRHFFNVVTFDLRGHGRSQGKRLFVRSFDEYLSDLQIVYARVQQKTNLPLFLLGHSMGGAIATLYSLTHPSHFDGLILSGPLLHIGEGFSPIKVAMAKMLGKIFPRLPVVSKIDTRLVSTDPAVVDDYENDPLNHHKGIPAGTGAATLQAIIRIQQEAPNMQKPLLILHGSKDRLADVEGSQFLYTHAQSTDKTLKLYEGFYHEVLNEPDKDQVWADMLDWLDRHA